MHAYQGLLLSSKNMLACNMNMQLKPCVNACIMSSSSVHHLMSGGARQPLSSILLLPAGILDALKHKYLKTLLFGISEDESGSVLLEVWCMFALP